MPKSNNVAVSRGKAIGILGGGQLARMLAIAAGRLGFDTIILEPAENCPAAQFANHQIVADYDNISALQTLVNRCDVITYEFENIPVSSIEALENSRPIFPSSRALEISQDRLVEKQFINSFGLATADFAPVSNENELEKAIATIGLPSILKTRRFGYDGKGQMRLDKKMQDPVSQAGDILQAKCILEAMVDFVCEISVIGARDRNGHTACFEPARNTHKDGILVSSLVPSGLSQTLIDEAKRQAVMLMERLDYVGVIGVEFFVTKSGELLINEFAPRVHNSGHWTEAACLNSQFEQHIRAITGLPLASPLRHSDCAMHNLIGSQIDELANIAAQPDTLVHDYGKRQTRDGRKMGHYTTLSPKS